MKPEDKFKKATDNLFDYLELFKNDKLKKDVSKIIHMFNRLAMIGEADEDTKKVFAYLMNKIRLNQKELIKEFYE
jgi:hypothetical protein